MTLPARRWLVLAGGVLVLAGAFGILAWRLQTTARRYQAAALRGDSLEATLDLTRTLKRNDSLVFLRRIVQEVQRSSALEDSLGLERRARYAVTVRFDSLLAVVSQGVVRTDSADSVRRAHFEETRPPFHLAAEVALPRSGMGTLTSSIWLDPMPLGATVGCGKAVAGVRRATLLLDAPSWATVSLDRLSQDPAVCNAKAGLPPPKAGYGPWRFARDAALVILGWLSTKL